MHSQLRKRRRWRKRRSQLSPSLQLHLANRLQCLPTRYLRNWTRLSTVKALRTAPLYLPILFPDSVIKQAEEDIASYDKGQSGSVYKKGHYHPYERTESKSDNKKQDRLAWKNLSCGHNRRSKEKHQFSSDLPRASNLINDNYCISMLQGRLLAGSPSI